MRKKIDENLKKLNISSRVRVHPVALSDENIDQVEFYTSTESSGISSLIPFHASHRSTFSVSVKTFTDWERINAVEEVDFLKIDVEGNDIRVLKGFNWDKFSPETIVVEYEDNKTKHLQICMKDIQVFLEAKGYYVILSEWLPIEKYGVAHKWKQFLLASESSSYDPKGWGNIIAIKNVDIGRLCTAIQQASNEEINHLNFKLQELRNKNEKRQSRRLSLLQRIRRKLLSHRA